MARTPSTTDRDGIVKLDGNYLTPFWTGTFTTGIEGRFHHSTRQGGRSYFMVAPNGRDVALDAPWIRQADKGWNVILDGTVLETVRTKSDAQRAAESLLNIG